MSLRMVCGVLLLISTVSCTGRRGFSVGRIGIYPDGTRVRILIEKFSIPDESGPVGGDPESGIASIKWDKRRTIIQIVQASPCVYEIDEGVNLSVSALACYVTDECLKKSGCEVVASETALTNTCDLELTIEIRRSNWPEESTIPLKLPSNEPVNLAATPPFSTVFGAE